MSEQDKPGWTVTAAVWATMASIYGGRWSHSFGDVGGTAFEIWRRTLAGIDGGRVVETAGGYALSDHAYPPTLPEFRSKCLIDPASPSEPDAMAEACRRASQRTLTDDDDWSHPAVMIAARDVGSWTLNNTRAETLSRQFFKAYRAAQLRHNPYLLETTNDEHRKPAVRRDRGGQPRHISKCEE